MHLSDGTPIDLMIQSFSTGELPVYKVHLLQALKACFSEMLTRDDPIGLYRASREEDWMLAD